MSYRPKISVITPAYQCGQYLEKCIQSVLEQNYPDIEHIIMDGGSSDGTVSILKKYPHLVWKSEPDKGEADALNKALNLCTGDWVTWVNADDYLASGAFEGVERLLQSIPGADLIYGNALHVDLSGNPLWSHISYPKVDLQMLLKWWDDRITFDQRAMFFRHSKIKEVGLFNTSLYYSIDYEYWLRMAGAGSRICFYPGYLGCARVRTDGKSSGDIKDQLSSHWEVSLPYHGTLSEEQRIRFWRDFFIYNLRRNWEPQLPERVDSQTSSAIKAGFSRAKQLLYPVKQIAELFINGNYTEAASLVEPWIVNTPLNPMVWNDLGAIRFQQGNHKEAGELFRKALQIDSGYARAKNNLSDLLRITGQTIEAEDLEKTIGKGNQV